MKKTKCIKCFADIKNCNSKKHVLVCNGIYRPFKKLTYCPYCNIELNPISNTNRANHVRWCNKNPKRNSYINHKSKNVSHFNTPSVKAKRMEAIRQSRIDGKLKMARLDGSYKLSLAKALATKRKNGTLFPTDKTRKLLSEKALASPHRRLVRSMREYKRKDGSLVMLDSSWEECLAKRLDDINVDWIRPISPIKYTCINGKLRNYFPDFYLPKFDLYLDPKNPIAMRVQQEKINILLKKMNNLILLTTLEECKIYSPNNEGDVKPSQVGTSL